jgi:hypothetical protein
LHGCCSILLAATRNAFKATRSHPDRLPSRALGSGAQFQSFMEADNLIPVTSWMLCRAPSDILLRLPERPQEQRTRGRSRACSKWLQGQPR